MGEGVIVGVRVVVGEGVIVGVGVVVGEGVVLAVGIVMSLSATARINKTWSLPCGHTAVLIHLLLRYTQHTVTTKKSIL